MSVETDISELKTSMEQIKKSVDRIDKFIIGNGEGGLLSRTTRIEESGKLRSDRLKALEMKIELDTQQNKKDMKEFEKCFKNMEDLFQSTVKNIDSMCLSAKTTFQNHINDDDLHTARGLLLKKDVLTIAILIAILIHVLLPPEFNIFGLLLNFFGL